MGGARSGEENGVDGVDDVLVKVRIGWRAKIKVWTAWRKGFDFVPQPPKIAKYLEPSSKNGFSAVALPSPTFLTLTPNNLSLSFSLRHNE